jgi:hypothetical protein
VPDGNRSIPIVVVPITRGSNSGWIVIQATSDTTEKLILPTSRTTARPNGSGIDEKSSILIYKPRSKGKLLKSLINYGIYPILIYEMSGGFNPLK